MRWVSIKWLCLFVLAAGLATAVGTAQGSDGRWKIAGDGSCVWDATDSGPNQCFPPGRWKIGDEGNCYWDAVDSGPDQCQPAEAPAADRSLDSKPSGDAQSARVDVQPTEITQKVASRPGH